MNENNPLVCVIDDEPSIRKSLSNLLRSAGLQVRAFPSAQEFLASWPREAPSCLVLDVQLPEDELRSEISFPEMVGKSAALRHVLQQVEMVAPSDSTVLILGETGAGKELIARAVHERSRRRDKPLVRVNWLFLLGVAPWTSMFRRLVPQSIRAFVLFLDFSIWFRCRLLFITDSFPALRRLPASSLAIYLAV